MEGNRMETVGGIFEAEREMKRSRFLAHLVPIGAFESLPGEIGIEASEKRFERVGVFVTLVETEERLNRFLREAGGLIVSVGE